MNVVVTRIFDKNRSAIAGLILSFLAINSYGQGDKKFIRQGNREYENDKYSESEILYRKAADKNKRSHQPVFNIGDALYKQKKYDEAGKQFESNAGMNDDADGKSAALFNLGNSLFMSDKLEESIKAYKNALKIQPDNMEAKYNLAFAQDMLKKQQQQQQQQQQQDQNNKNQDNQENKNKQDNKNNKEQDKDQNKDQNNDQNKDQKNDQNKDQQQGISKDDAERLLNAIANDEKNVQEKVKLAKAAKAKVRTLKNW